MSIARADVRASRTTRRTALAGVAFVLAIPASGQHVQHVHSPADSAPTLHCAAHATEEHVALVQPGQAIFGALQEVLERLEADPATDWTRVDLDALREHLVQMDLLFREAEVSRQPLQDGMRFEVRGSDDVLRAAEAIGAMHAEMLRASAPSWEMRVAKRQDAVELEVRSSELAQQVRIRALGFAGLLTLGTHHADHHWAMATGRAPHRP